MISNSIKLEGVEGFNDALTQFKMRDLSWIVRQSINDTAFKLRDKSQSLAKAQLDRPRPFTIKSFRVRKAPRITAANIAKVSAEVYIHDDAAHYMDKLIHGGIKTSGKDTILFINKRVRLNKHGNLAGLQGGKKFDRLLASPKRFGFSRRGFDKDVHGIWERYGGKKNKRVRPLIILQDRRVVKKKLYWYEMLNNQGPKVLGDYFNSYLDEKIAHLKTNGKYFV